MRFKKTYLKVSLLTLVLLLAFIHYPSIDSQKQPNQRLIENPSRLKLGSLDSAYLAADFEPSDEISTNFLNDPIINHIDYSFIHTSEKACTNKSVDLLVAIQSSLINFDRRRLARQGRRNNEHSTRIVYLFFTGKAANNMDALKDRIDYEAKVHGDIVQADIVDSARNMSLLSALILKWIVSYCPNVSFVVKKIDDGWMNYVQILQALRQKEADYKYFMMGNSATVLQSPLRYIIYNYYKNISQYRDSPFIVFIKEPVYGFPRRTAMLLYQTTLRTYFFWREEVFITGICANRARVPVFFDHNFIYK
ncbi:hypothetical protein BsWGS_05271 [Bradybaena similaris]